MANTSGLWRRGTTGSSRLSLVISIGLLIATAGAGAGAAEPTPVKDFCGDRELKV